MRFLAISPAFVVPPLLLPWSFLAPSNRRQGDKGSSTGGSGGASGTGATCATGPVAASGSTGSCFTAARAAARAGRARGAAGAAGAARAGAALPGNGGEKSIVFFWETSNFWEVWTNFKTFQDSLQHDLELIVLHAWLPKFGEPQRLTLHFFAILRVSGSPWSPLTLGGLSKLRMLPTLTNLLYWWI